MAVFEPILGTPLLHSHPVSSSNSYSPATKVIAPIGSGFSADYYTDGVADDVEIQAALTAINTLGGGILLVKTGTYAISTSITLYANITIRGEGIGRTIFKSSTANDAFVIGSNGGNSSGSADPAGTFLNMNFYDFEFDSQTTKGSCLALYAPGNVNIERVYVHDTVNFGLYVVNCNNLWIKDSYIKNIIGNGGIQLKGIHNGYINENTIFNVVNGSLSKGIGSHASSGTNGRTGQNVHITKNNLDTVSFGIDCEDNYSEVVNNTVNNFYSSGIETRSNPVFLNISDNIINTGLANGAVGISSFFVTSGASDITIDNNQITNVNFDNTSNGIFSGANVIRGICTNNKIINSGRYGIFNRSANLLVDNNYMTGNPSGDLFNDTNASVLGGKIKQYTSPNGQDVTIIGGDADVNSTNINSGSVILTTGNATGNGFGQIQFAAAGAGASGHTNSLPTTLMRFYGFGHGRMVIGNSSTTSNLTDGINFVGDVARGLIMLRNTTANTAGFPLSLKASAATLQATNKNGGNAIVAGGISTGSGTSQIQLQVSPATSNTTTALASVTLNAAGSGYTAADVLTVSGGTGGTITVNTVSAAGVINVTAINAIGSSYVVGDVLTISGGAANATITINTVDSNGGILAYTLTTAGTGYSTGTGVSLTGGSGTGATININSIFATGAILTYTLTTAGSGYTLTTGAATTYGGAGTGGTFDIVPYANTDNTLATVMTVLGSGNVQLTNLVSTYNNIATVSNGIPSELATIDTTGLTANVGASTLYAVPASGAGMYRVSVYVVETTAGSLSSTLPNAQIVFTDNDTGGSITIDATPILGIAGIGQTGALTANTVGTAASGVIVINVKASTTIQYQTVNYASNLAGMTYAIHIKLEAL